MRIAALYDIHGNAPALEAVLREVEAALPDLVVVGGDVVSGPLPAQTLELLRALHLPVRYVRGNGDREVLAARTGGGDGAAWVAAQLDDADAALLSSFEDGVSLEVSGLGPTLFCHGSPRSDEEILTAATAPGRLRRILAGTAEAAVVCGHTHVQFDRAVDGWRVVNAGSVGMPYEAAPGAYWALLGPGVALRRTAYDLPAAAARIRDSGWPGATEFAEENVLRVPTAEEATELFEQKALEREAQAPP